MDMPKNGIPIQIRQSMDYSMEFAICTQNGDWYYINEPPENARFLVFKLSKRKVLAMTEHMGPAAKPLRLFIPAAIHHRYLH